MSQDYLDKLIEKDETGTQIQSIPLHDTELRGITIDEPITVEGNPINFSTKNEQNAIQTIVDIDPIQDLHGYSKPWVGGAGKNLFNPTALTTTQDHVTFTNNGDGTYTLNGTASADIDFSIEQFNAPAISTQYRMVGCPSGMTNKAFLQIRGTEWLDTGDGVTATSADTSTHPVQIRVKNGAVLNNVVFKPMFSTDTSITYNSYEPYTNICPITPHEEIKIGGCGKNFVDYNTKGDYDVTGTGTIRIGFKPVWLNPGTYTASFKSKDPNNMAIYVTNITNNYTYTEINSSTKYVTFTLTEKSLIMIRTSRPAGYASTTYVEELQLEKSETKTSYEPYQESNKFAIDLPSTVYGGTLNLETGELVVDKKYVALSTISSGSWNKSSYSAIPSERAVYWTILEDCKYTGNNQNVNNVSAVYNSYEAGTSSYESIATKTVFSIGLGASSNKSTIGINVDNSISSTSAFVTWLASNEIEVTYPLATPYTLQLTPAQLKLFKDVNNLNSSDYTTLNVTYHSNSIATLTPATDTTDGLLSAMDKRALDRTEEIIEGNPIAFETESVQVAKSTIVDLEPIQDLHGFSKPWVGGAGKNLLPMTVDWIKTNNTNGTWNGLVFTHDSGVVYTILVDNDNNVIGIKLNGTPSYTSYFSPGIFNFAANVSYLVNGGVNGGSQQSYFAAINNGINLYDSSDGTQSFTTDTSAKYFVVAIANATISNKIFYPMIRLSTVTDATFEPYTNIASISGRSEVDILGCGKNMLPFFNETKTGGNAKVESNANGTYHFYTTATTTDANILSYSLSGYTFRGNYKMVCNYPYGTGIGSCDIYYTEKSNPGVTKALRDGQTINADECNILSIAFYYPQSTTFDVNNIQVELHCIGDNDIFESYTQSTSLQIQLGQTVYGGQLDVENGVLVVDRTLKTLDGTESWYNSISDKPSWFFTTWTKDTQILSQGINAISSKYNIRNNVDRDSLANGEGIVSTSQVAPSNSSIIVRDDRFTDTSTFTSDLTSNNLEVIYELSTPTTISLTPEQVKLLQGVNTITTNADNITLTYRNGSVATLNDLESLYAKLKAYIDSLHSS